MLTNVALFRRFSPASGGVLYVVLSSKIGEFSIVPARMYLSYSNMTLHLLMASASHSLSRHAILETLFYNRRVAVKELLVQEPARAPLYRQPQATPLTTDLLLEVMIEEGVRIIKSLVAAVACKGRFVVRRHCVERNMRGEEYTSGCGQSGVSGNGYACIAVWTYLPVVVFIMWESFLGA